MTRRVALVVALVGLTAGLVALPGVAVRATYGAQVSADEPYYLLTAISLAEDGDLDIRDELEARRYRDFHEALLPEQTRPLSDGRRLAPHDPLLPLLLAVPWRLGGWVGAKVALAVMGGALAALTTWVAIRRFHVAPGVAAVTVGLVSAAWPLSAYATQVYPEVPAALTTVGAIAVATGPLRRWTAPVLALLISLLPWLAIKYGPVAAALTAVVVARWWRAGHRVPATGLVGTLVVSGGMYLALHLAWYEGVTVYAAGDHFTERGQLSVVGYAPDYLGRARRLIGLLIDRDFGLAAWQPAWLLAVPAVVVMLRRRPPGWDPLIVPLIVGWLNATFVALTMQGWWVPGRQVVVVLPLAAIALAWWLGMAGRVWRAAAYALGGLGVLSYLLLVRDGLAGDIAWIVDFARVSDPLYQVRRAMLPNYLTVTAATWVWQSLWLAVTLGLSVVAWRGVSRDSRSPRA